LRFKKTFSFEVRCPGSGAEERTGGLSLTT
jgi:hypothetical protein